MIMVSFCWKMNVLPNKIKNNSVSSTMFLKLTIKVVAFFLGHPVYNGFLTLITIPFAFIACYKSIYHIFVRNENINFDNITELFARHVLIWSDCQIILRTMGLKINESEWRGSSPLYNPMNLGIMRVHTIQCNHCYCVIECVMQYGLYCLCQKSKLASERMWQKSNLVSKESISRMTTLFFSPQACGNSRISPSNKHSLK